MGQPLSHLLHSTTSQYQSWILQLLELHLSFPSLAGLQHSELQYSPWYGGPPHCEKVGLAHLTFSILVGSATLFIYFLHFTVSQLLELTAVVIWARLYLYNSFLQQNLAKCGSTTQFETFWRVWASGLPETVKSSQTKTLQDLGFELIYPFLGSFLTGKRWSFKKFSKATPSLNNTKKEKF